MLFFLLPHRFRWLLLLIASCFFYMTLIPIYILILFLTITVDYLAGIMIEDAKDKKQKLLFLVISIISTLGILFVFKYFDFFSVNFNAIASFLHWNYSIGALKLLLPIGLSFHTFQSMSYVIEVYWGKQKAERNYGMYSLYVMFYPQLVAGPIERPQNLLHQFYEKHYFEYKRVTEGLKMMLLGLFKKIVIADNLTIVVNTIYNNPTEYTGIPLILGTIFFAFQIYCDFSGYSEIAIGAAHVMGFKLMTNFRRPYYSRSIGEFWKRWHISLSTWFKDYVYIPLGGSRVSTLRIYFNLFVVFLISGIWHGANWTYVIWGALHGIYRIISLVTEKIRNKFTEKIGLVRHPGLHALLKISITFILVNIGWIFFRANNLEDAMYILTHLFTGLTLNFSGIMIGTNWTGLLIIFISILIMEIFHLIQEHRSMRDFIASKPVMIRWSVYIFLIWLIILWGAKGADFIYFQF